MTWKEIVEALGQPFATVKFRIGSRNPDKSKGQILTYIDARHVMDRFDEVVGPENWQSHFRFEGGRTICTLQVRAPGTQEWIAKEDGAGDTELEGEKGGISDALKRTAVHFNCGRYLYALPRTYAWLEDNGRRITKPEQQRLADEYRRIVGLKKVETESDHDEDEESPAPPPPQRSQARSSAPARDRVAEGNAIEQERKALSKLNFELAEKYFGKPIPQERRFEIMDWAMAKCGFRYQKALDTLEKIAQVRNWMEKFDPEEHAKAGGSGF